jgi:hypothetical protein
LFHKEEVGYIVLFIGDLKPPGGLPIEEESIAIGQLRGVERNRSTGIWNILLLIAIDNAVLYVKSVSGAYGRCGRMEDGRSGQ